MNHDDYWFRLCNIEGIYQPQIKELLDVFNTPEEIFRVSDKDIENAVKGRVSSFNAEILNNILCQRKDETILYRRDIWERNEMRFISIDNPEFPEKLRILPDTPYSLYVRGKLPGKNEPLLGMVGARACSEYGRRMAGKIGREAAEGGLSVVSGMARGIDSLSAEGALSVGGKTYAILGSGIDVIYPPENIELYYNIIMTGGVISEYKPGTKPLGWQFPLRNRIISGLSDILLVIEAGKRSGTLSTARHALEQNKDIYALPGRVTDPLSRGCNALISDGAGIYQNTAELTAQILLMHNKLPEKSKKNKESEYSGGFHVVPNSVRENEDWLKIYNAVGEGPSGFSEIVEKSGLSAASALRILAELDINGFIREVSKDVYSISDFS